MSVQISFKNKVYIALLVIFTTLNSSKGLAELKSSPISWPQDPFQTLLRPEPVDVREQIKIGIFEEWYNSLEEAQRIRFAKAPLPTATAVSSVWVSVFIRVTVAVGLDVLPQLT